MIQWESDELGLGLRFGVHLVKRADSSVLRSDRCCCSKMRAFSEAESQVSYIAVTQKIKTIDKYLWTLWHCSLFEGLSFFRRHRRQPSWIFWDRPIFGESLRESTGSHGSEGGHQIHVLFEGLKVNPKVNPNPKPNSKKNFKKKLKTKTFEIRTAQHLPFSFFWTTT